MFSFFKKLKQVVNSVIKIMKTLEKVIIFIETVIEKF